MLRPAEHQLAGVRASLGTAPERGPSPRSARRYMLTKTAYRVTWALYGEELNRTVQHKFRVRGAAMGPCRCPLPPLSPRLLRGSGGATMLRQRTQARRLHR